MSLYSKLLEARSEEDVKDAYIKALWLKDYQKNLIDIQTKEIWFEAKVWAKISTYEMFTQLLHYVQHNLNLGEDLPPFLCVIDSEKAAIMKTADAIPLLAKKDIKRWKSASQVTQDALDKVSAYIGTYIVSFRICSHEEEFINTVKSAIQSGDIIRTQITPDNLKQVFDKWIEMIAKEIKWVDPQDYSLLFFADIMNDGTLSTHENLPAQLLFKNNTPVFWLGGNIYELGNKEWYRKFRSIYDRPPKAEYRDYLLERRDSLIPIDERSFKWAYYTPLHVVDKAYDLLTETLGKNRQREYIIRDMCCGVGNLEVKHSNPRNIYMSTLDQPDIDVMKATKTCVAATRFQYDYLNDDISDSGDINYSLTEKLPSWLRDAISSGKKILVLINPPYAEATNANNTSDNSKSESKKWVQKTKVASYIDKWWYATRELFVQFLIRISKEMPNSTLAMFSKLKYVNSPNFELFRDYRNVKYLNWFIVDSKAFEWLKWNFPIWFLIWKINQLSKDKTPIIEISTEILDKNAKPQWEKKFYNLPNNILLGTRIKRPKVLSDSSIEIIPLKNAISPAVVIKDVRWTKWPSDSIACIIFQWSDIQSSNSIALLSSGYWSAGSIYINPTNLRQAAIVFSVRRLIKPTWINDRDQFLQPNCELSDEFKSDALIYMLFSWSNLTASADDLERNGRKWSIVNHFIPYTEAEVWSPDRFESDFMVQYIYDLPVIERGAKQSSPFSIEAQAVLDAGRKLRKAYFEYIDNHTTRDEYKLNRADVWRYQVRNALRKRNESWDYIPVSFAEFESAYKSLTEKLRPLVYEYWFLKV